MHVTSYTGEVVNMGFLADPETSARTHTYIGNVGGWTTISLLLGSTTLSTKGGPLLGVAESLLSHSFRVENKI